MYTDKRIFETKMIKHWLLSKECFLYKEQQNEGKKNERLTLVVGGYQILQIQRGFSNIIEMRKKVIQ